MEDDVSYYSLRELEHLVDIPLRRLRYVLDNDLISSNDWSIDVEEPGTPRKFNELTAVFISCAGFLLEAGYRRESIREFLLAIRDFLPRGRNQLNFSYIKSDMVSFVKDAKIKFADGTHVCFVVEEESSGWHVISKKRLISNTQYIPKVIVEVDLGEVRDLVRGMRRTN